MTNETRFPRRRFLRLAAMLAGEVALSMLPGCRPSLGRVDAGTVLPSATHTATAAGIASAGASTGPSATSSLTPLPTDTAAPTATPAPVAVQSTATPKAYLPHVQRSTVSPPPTSTPTTEPTPTVPAPLGPKVVHVHDQAATSWTGQTSYWNYVNQSAVNEMLDEGLMALTGAATVADAWRVLIPNYQAGQVVAIKANFNNSDGCDDVDGQIDGLIQPVNAVVRGLKLIGVPESSICVFDASRRIPTYFVSGCLYSGVVFRDSGCRQYASWSSSDPNAYVTFQVPEDLAAPPATRVDDVLISSSYLINMPILKPHRIAGVTLTFKNHFGNISAPWDLHPYIGIHRDTYRSDYNPLVDIYRNPHIADKTVLVLADGLFAAHDFEAPPSTWSTFGGQLPNSLLVSTDPVAIDSVMCDLLQAELGLAERADDYLALAHQAGLGTYERGDPWSSGYASIDYVRLG